MIKVNYIIKTIRLLIMMSYISLMFGLLWYIICDFVLVDQTENVSAEEQDPAIYENFLTHFAITEKSTTDQMWALTYFAFTTVSTVGFGDFHPRSNTERLIGSIVMLLGVMINSIVVESLALMIKGIRMVDDDYEEYA